MEEMLPRYERLSNTSGLEDYITELESRDDYHPLLLHFFVEALADVQFQLGDYEEALFTYEKALRLDDQNQSIESIGRLRHEWGYCSICRNAPFYGIRYKCKRCVRLEFSVCSTCILGPQSKIGHSSEHDGPHDFLRIPNVSFHIGM
jgi:tetratricopeptide (TPR) repeat protein